MLFRNRNHPPMIDGERVPEGEGGRGAEAQRPYALLLLGGLEEAERWWPCGCPNNDNTTTITNIYTHTFGRGASDTTRQESDRDRQEETASQTNQPASLSSPLSGQVLLPAQSITNPLFIPIHPTPDPTKENRTSFASSESFQGQK